MTLFANTAKMRPWAGSNGMATPSPCTKNEKVGVAPGAMSSMVTLGAARHEPASVRQTETLTGRLPALAETVTLPAAPTLDVATANAAAPPGPGRSTVRPGVWVAARAMTSGPGVEVATRRKVLSPATGVTGTRLAPAKTSWAVVVSKAALGVKAMTKLWACPGAMFTGVFGVPVGLLAGSAVW